MPWEKDFDVEEAVDLAMGVFKAKGYKATSITDLSHAMKLNKGSIYNAYGSKKALFLRALDKYDREKRRAMLTKLSAMEDPLEAIRLLFTGLVEESMTDQTQSGCLLVNTALDLPNHDEDVQKLVKEAMEDFENFFFHQLEKAVESGALPKSFDMKSTAAALLSYIVSIRVLARGVFDRDGLTTLSNQALKLITP
ncbi:TetR family transcriptional regulator [Sneathiella sp. P13V-1]|uniref:TetR/AcrR family transcriptional regulator n=1 Tax=Sneathiella sp. P13V-1 TaxID=2697366 RepID=UPI00187BAEF5|nr:TetR/AcrR family transcriptional regulator [Sneathiella sp. P13V-1]MBE7636161.1 TetR family transcriptional regulator [Sneathiella sp. P13V-1]